MSAPEPICCGKAGVWANGGGPLVAGCRICPESPTYWKLPANRADGQPYRELTLDESYRRTSDR
jgi:hypothetical protein